MGVRGLDRRVNAFRDDLAAAHLRGEVDAKAFVDGDDFQVMTAATGLLRHPAYDAPMDTELLMGETFHVFSNESGWSWGQSAADDYVGYIISDDLQPLSKPVTHRVSALRTFVYPEPDTKSRPAQGISMNAKVTIRAAADRFSEIEGGGYVVTAHLAPLNAHVSDFVDVAESFLGTPYLWGGRSSVGLDCSALVQMSLERAGVACLRDTDMQEATLGRSVEMSADLSGLARGDLVYWKGHVGIMRDEATLLHANATHMAVASEPLSLAIDRIAKTDGPVTSVRRL